MESLPQSANESVNESCLVRRLRESLDLVLRTGTADKLDDHLKYLADLDAARAAQSYGDNTAGGLVKPTPLFRSASLSRLPSLAQAERIALPFC